MISIKSFSALVRDQVTEVQGKSSALVDFTIGSILRAVVEAQASVAMWLQEVVLQVVAMSRAATSDDDDLDSWMDDYGVKRIPASYATGYVELSRFTASGQALVPVGTVVQTLDGTQKYLVTSDVGSGNYSAALASYVLPNGIFSVSVPVVAVTAGAGGNAAIGAISTIAQATPNIDKVTNNAAFVNGADKESNIALRIRFVKYIASLSKATKDAVGYAISSIQPGITYTITENKTYAGDNRPGYFYAVVDDGTGSPTATFISKVSAAIDSVRPLTVGFGVFAPATLSVSASVVVAASQGYVQNEVALVVKNAITNYLNSLSIAEKLPYTRLLQVAYDASPGVANVSNLAVNGGTSDIAPISTQIIRAGAVTVS